MVFALRMTRAATTLAGPCTGAQRRDFLLGLRHGQLVGAQVPSWCSWHGWTLVAPNELARLASLQLVATRHLEGTGVDAPGRPQRARVAVLEPTPGGVHEPGEHRRPRSRQAHLSAPWSRHRGRGG